LPVWSTIDINTLKNVDLLYDYVNSNVKCSTFALLQMKIMYYNYIVFSASKWIE